MYPTDTWSGERFIGKEVSYRLDQKSPDGPNVPGAL